MEDKRWMPRREMLSLGPRAVIQSVGTSGVELRPALDVTAPAAFLTSGPLAGVDGGRPFRRLSHMLVGLHETDRRYVLKEFDFIQHELEDALASAHIYLNSQPAEAMSVMLGHLRKGLIVTQLKSAYLLEVAGRSGVESPDDYKELKAAYYARVVPKIVLSARASGHWSAHHDLELGAGIGEAIPTMEELEQVVPRRVLLDAQLDLLVEGLAEVLIRKEVERVGHVQASLQATLDGSSRFSSGDSKAAVLSHEISDSDYATKLGFVREVASALTSRGIRLEPLREDASIDEIRGRNAMLNDTITETMILVPASVFASSLDEMAGRLHAWHEERVAAQTRSEAQVVETLKQKLYVAEQEKRHLELLRTEDEKRVKTRVQVEVADKGFELIRQIAHIYRELARFKEVMENQAVQIREEVKQEYDELVHDLYTQYVSTRANFEEYRNFLYQEIQNELHVVKQDAMKKLLNISQLPSAERKRVAQMADLEADMNKLKSVSTNLEKTVLKLKTMHTLKEIALRQTFEKRVREERRERVKKTKKLFEMREAMEQDKEMLTQLLATTQNALSNAESEVETLRKNLQLQQKNKKALVHWKVTKSHVLEALQEKVDRYEKWGNVDVDKLLLELDRKDAELHELRDRTTRMERIVELEKRRKGRQLNELHSALASERALKTQAFDEVEGLRALAIQANAGDAPLERAAWKQKFDTLLEDMHAVRYENDVLRAHLNGGGAGPTIPSRRSGSSSRASSRAGSSRPSTAQGAPIRYRPSSKGGSVYSAAAAGVRK